ncbi:hypothetical protein B005_1108 [Nocardiopsis alba ATCC BAA-2165]|uniref:Uncharacterized protein n=1 Tax=Nocardiopsis alba (strain ATCC BAA-2165 / BE74) TaxID=1205910 RepID=J7L709_NOCAA|nr:hypothetical protein B005_1108 [Nocardiopsis alba ATCC BAA-2165]
MFGDFLAGTVAFCANRCHEGDDTEIASRRERAGGVFGRFTKALIIVPSKGKFTFDHEFPDVPGAFSVDSAGRRRTSRTTT